MVWPDRKSTEILAASANPDAPNPYHTDFSMSDFQGFEWISLESYTGIKDFMGMKCIVYQGIRKIKSDDPGQPVTYQPVTAYVEIESRLPIALVTGDQVSLYEWKPAPQAVQPVSPSVQSILDRQQRAADQMARQPARPF